MKEILAEVEKRGYRYKIVSLLGANFAENSPLHRLTEKQRKILLTAYRLGYYDVPKKINSDELGTYFRLAGSTVVEHLKKAERRLLAGIIDEDYVEARKLNLVHPAR